MLAFYGRKGSPEAGLIQDVAIEAGHAVTEIPTWMGLTARWRVKCISLTEAGYPGWVQEAQTGDSKARTSAISAVTRLPAPALWALGYCTALPAERSGFSPGLSPSRHSTTSSVGKVPSLVRGPYLQTSEDEAVPDAGPTNPSSGKKGRRSQGSRGSRSGEGSESSHSTKSSTSSRGGRKKKDGFSSKI